MLISESIVTLLKERGPLFPFEIVQHLKQFKYSEIGQAIVGLRDSNVVIVDSNSKVSLAT